MEVVLSTYRTVIRKFVDYVIENTPMDINSARKDKYLKSVLKPMGTLLQIIYMDETYIAVVQIHPTAKCVIRFEGFYNPIDVTYHFSPWITLNETIRLGDKDEKKM